jgi:hypothetical protein
MPITKNLINWICPTDNNKKFDQSNLSNIQTITKNWINWICPTDDTKNWINWIFPESVLQTITKNWINWICPSHNTNNWINWVCPYNDEKLDQSNLSFRSLFAPTTKSKSTFPSRRKLNRFEFQTGSPDFNGKIYQKRGHIYKITIKYTKWPQTIPNNHKIYQMATKYTKCP